MPLLNFSSFLPFTLSVFSLSFAVVCFVFFCHIYLKLLDIKYLIRLFLMSAALIYFIFDVMYYLISILNFSDSLKILSYSIKELLLFLFVIILQISMKEIFYKGCFSSRVLNIITSLSILVLLFILVLFIVNENTFIKQNIRYLNVYHNKVSVYGVGLTFIIKDISVAFILIFNVVCMFDVIVSQKKISRYNLILLLSILLLLISFVDDCYATYFFEYKTVLIPFIPRISIGLLLFLMGALSSNVLRFLHNLRYIELKKESYEYKIKTDNNFINDSNTLLSGIFELEDSLGNELMSLINVSKSTIDYMDKIKLKLKKIYEDDINFLNTEYNRQGKNSYNINTLNKLSESFESFDAKINNTKDVIISLTNTAEELTNKSDVITQTSNLIVKNIDNYLGISKEKLGIISNHFRKSSSFDMLTSYVKRILMSIKGMSERVSTVSVNSSIQASKSGEYANSFSFISKEINSLVDETVNTTKKLEYIVTYAGKIFSDFSQAKISIVDNITSLNNYISSLSLNISIIPNIFSMENEKNRNIIDNNRALDTFIENILFLLKDEIENCRIIKNEVDSVISYISKIDVEYNYNKKKIYFSKYDLNKMKNMLKELHTSSIEFDKVIRDISIFFERILGDR